MVVSKYAVIENAVVVNVIMAEGPIPGLMMVQSNSAAPGDLYSAGVFTRPAPVILVPQKVSFRQAKTQMLLVGMWDGAISAANAIADPVTRIKTLGLLIDSTEYERQRPELIGFAKGTLGLTDAQLDSLFIAAAAL